MTIQLRRALSLGTSVTVAAFLVSGCHHSKKTSSTPGPRSSDEVTAPSIPTGTLVDSPTAVVTAAPTTIPGLKPLTLRLGDMFPKEIDINTLQMSDRLSVKDSNGVSVDYRDLSLEITTLSGPCTFVKDNDMIWLYVSVEAKTAGECKARITVTTNDKLAQGTLDVSVVAKDPANPGTPAPEGKITYSCNIASSFLCVYNENVSVTRESAKAACESGDEPGVYTESECPTPKRIAGCLGTKNGEATTSLYYYSTGDANADKQFIEFIRPQCDAGFQTY